MVAGLWAWWILVPTVIAGVASWWMTGGVLRYALSKSLLDFPNDRSSHSVPTPRGGGMAIAGVTLTGVAISGLVGLIEPELAIGFIGGGAVVALAGWIDDSTGLTVRWRLLAQLVAAGWALGWLGGLPSLDLGFTQLELGWLGIPIGIVGIVWSTNLYNFMDGIDGIAGVQGASVAFFAGLLLLLTGSLDLALIVFLVSAACAGFLLWNWHPARIFMGDVGSGLLGFFFAVFAIASEARTSVPLLIWALLGSVFIFDATVTLLRRLRRGEKVVVPHRTHAYQRATEIGWSHAQVASAVLAINVALGTIAILAVSAPETTLLPAVLAGYALVASCYHLVERIKPM